MSGDGGRLYAQWVCPDADDVDVDVRSPSDIVFVFRATGDTFRTSPVVPMVGYPGRCVLVWNPPVLRAELHCPGEAPRALMVKVVRLLSATATGPGPSPGPEPGARQQNGAGRPGRPVPRLAPLVPVPDDRGAAAAAAASLSSSATAPSALPPADVVSQAGNNAPPTDNNAPPTDNADGAVAVAVADTTASTGTGATVPAAGPVPPPEAPRPPTRRGASAFGQSQIGAWAFGGGGGGGKEDADPASAMAGTDAAAAPTEAARRRRRNFQW